MKLLRSLIPLSLLVGCWFVAARDNAAVTYECKLADGRTTYTVESCPPGSVSSIYSNGSQVTPRAGTDETDLQTHKHYTNSAGDIVHSPSTTISGQVPAGASAQCGDGTYSFSRNHRGTCSHHGGVARWL